MKLTTSTVQMLLIEGADRLDPIRVITQNERPGAGRIIIQCWDRAWCSYWGAMGSQENPSTIAEFFMRMDTCYISGNLRNSLRRFPCKEFERDAWDVEQGEQKYMKRIIEAVQAAFRQQAAAAQPAAVLDAEFHEVDEPAPPRFAMVTCSQCGGGFGPGFAGFSHCEDHAHLIALER